MTKPVITFRSDTDPNALTYEQLDTNFLNLRDATVSLTAGTGGTQVISDLNGNITLVAGTNITITGDNTTKQITINSTAGSNSFSIVNAGGTLLEADSISDTLNVTGDSDIQISGNATTDTLTVNLNSQLIGVSSITNSSNGAVINFPNGSIIASIYYRKRSNWFVNTSTPTVDLTPGRTDLVYDGTFELPISVSSLALTLATNSVASFEMIRLIFKTTSTGGTFNVTANTTVYWADGNKSCTRDGSTYMIEIQNRGVSGGTNGDVYYARLTRYAT